MENNRKKEEGKCREGKGVSVNQRRKRIGEERNWGGASRGREGRM